MNMNAVGIDVSKGKSMVAILRPYGEIISKPFEVKHTVSGIRSLIEQIQSIDGESRIVMETPVVITNLLSVNFRKLTFLYLP